MSEKVVLNGDFEVIKFYEAGHDSIRDLSLLVYIFHGLSNKDKLELRMTYSEIAEITGIEQLINIRGYLIGFVNRYKVVFSKADLADNGNDSIIVFQIADEFLYLNNNLDLNSDNLYLFDYDEFKSLKDLSRITYFILKNTKRKLPVVIPMKVIKHYFGLPAVVPKFLVLKTLSNICDDLNAYIPELAYKVHYNFFELTSIEFNLRGVAK